MQQLFVRPTRSQAPRLLEAWEGSLQTRLLQGIGGGLRSCMLVSHVAPAGGGIELRNWQPQGLALLRAGTCPSP